MKEVYILRHAEKDTAGVLTEGGRQLAKQLGGVLPAFATVTASNSPRTIETAALLAGREPTTDDRAGYYATTQDVSSDIAKLAAEKAISFYDAANIYNDGELREGIHRQALGLNDLIDSTLAGLNDGEAALVVSHDMTMTPAMILRGQPRQPIDYLSGYIVRDDGTVAPFAAPIQSI